ncbi:MAG: hypothetical protein Q9197_003162 [Variospora fuerteventurae]
MAGLPNKTSAWRTTLTRKFARMQCRRDEAADWEDVGNAWLKRPKDDPHPERWNVQQVVVGTTGKETQKDGDHSLTVVKQPFYGWKVSFPLDMIHNVHLEEYEVESWASMADEGAMRSIYVIRFKCVGQPTGRDVSEIPKPRAALGMAVEEGAMEMDENVAGAIRPDQYPLAVLCPELDGMYIRLAFEKPPQTVKRAPPLTRIDVWAWPMIVTVLSGRPWNAVENDDNHLSLNEWAQAKGSHEGAQSGAGLLTEVRSDGKVEWRLEPKAGAKRRPNVQGRQAGPAQSAYGMQSTYRGPPTYERPTEYPAPPDFGRPRQYIGPPPAPQYQRPAGPPSFNQGLPIASVPTLPHRPPPPPIGSPAFRHMWPEHVKKREREASSIEQLEAQRAEMERACCVSSEKVEDAEAAVSAAKAVLSAAKAEDRENRDELINLARELHARRAGH